MSIWNLDGMTLPRSRQIRWDHVRVRLVIFKTTRRLESFIICAPLGIVQRPSIA